MKLEVFEILEKFKQAKTKKERIEVLQKHKDVWALKDLLRASFDDVLQFNIPEGAPPYTPNRPESVPSSFHKRHKELGSFIVGGRGDNIPSYKRENKFVQLLESIHPRDAELVIAMKDKKLNIKNLTKKLVQEAYPDLIVE